MSIKVSIPIFDEEMLQRFKRQNEIAEDLIKQGIPTITAIVMSGDIHSAEIATERVLSGTPAIEALNHVGSYARFDWAVANLPKPVLFSMLPELWIGADPDDTKLEYLALWKEAYAANGNRMICDGEKCPCASERYELYIYRGQVGDTLGISWTTDKKIAKRFAKTGGGRQLVRGGKVLEMLVKENHVLAYLTGRGESEVIIDLSSVFTTPAPNGIIEVKL